MCAMKEEGDQKQGLLTPSPSTDVPLTHLDPTPILRKVSIRLMPFLGALYLLAYLDRANLSNMHDSIARYLSMSEAAYGNAAGVFFVGYCICEIPSNIFLEKFGAKTWISRIMITWGIITAGFVLIRTTTALVLMRLLLGIAEAGLYPGLLLYLTYWYNDEERASKLAVLVSCNPVAGIVGGLLSYGVLQLDGAMALQGWQWLYLMEGVPTVIMGVIVWVWLPNGPDAASWLTDQEKQWFARRKQKDTHSTSTYDHSMRTVWNTIRVPRNLFFAITYFFMTLPAYGNVFFLPALIQSLGVSSLSSNLLSSAPYAVAVVFIMLWSRHSDKKKERHYHGQVACLVAVVGYVVLALALHFDIRFLSFAALLLPPAGILCSNVLLMTWAQKELHVSRAVGLALVNSAGNIGGWIGPVIVGSCKDATGNHILGMLMMGASMAFTCILLFILKNFFLKNEDMIKSEIGLERVESGSIRLTLLSSNSADCTISN